MHGLWGFFGLVLDMEGNTTALILLFWLVALLAWPFGLLDDWLGLGRRLLSLV
ncbi:hypothetical protein AAII07_11095 [Microvirga sp. 0TCS3.31]